MPEPPHSTDLGTVTVSLVASKQWSHEASNKENNLLPRVLAIRTGRPFLLPNSALPVCLDHGPTQHSNYYLHPSVVCDQCLDFFSTLHSHQPPTHPGRHHSQQLQCLLIIFLWAHLIIQLYANMHTHTHTHTFYLTSVNCSYSSFCFGIICIFLSVYTISFKL